MKIINLCLSCSVISLGLTAQTIAGTLKAVPTSLSKVESVDAAHMAIVEQVTNAVGYKQMSNATISKIYTAREKLGKSGCVVVAIRWKTNPDEEIEVEILQPDHIESTDTLRNSFVAGGAGYPNRNYVPVTITEENGVKTFSYSYSGPNPNSSTPFNGTSKLVVDGSKFTIVDIYGTNRECDLGD